MNERCINTVRRIKCMFYTCITPLMHDFAARSISLQCGHHDDLRRPPGLRNALLGVCSNSWPLAQRQRSFFVAPWYSVLRHTPPRVAASRCICSSPRRRRQYGHHDPRLRTLSAVAAHTCPCAHRHSNFSRAFTYTVLSSSPPRSRAVADSFFRHSRALLHSEKTHDGQILHDAEPTIDVTMCPLRHRYRTVPGAAAAGASTRGRAMSGDS